MTLLLADRGFPMLHEEKTRSRVELAQSLFREYYASCFWHMKPDLVVTKEMLPAILKGLRTHGGRSGFLAADRLEKEGK
jgi:hypothetical protein